MANTMTLVVLAAGMSSRYGGTAKQTDGMGPHGETILDYSVHDALAAGFSRVVFVIRAEGENEFRRRVVDHLEPHVAVELAFQRLDDLPGGRVKPADRSKPWGTSHAVLAARDLLTDGPFAVINADDFYGAGSYRVMADYLSSVPMHAAPAKYCMVGFQLRNTLSDHGTVSRGVCSLDASGNLAGIEELTDIHKAGRGAEMRDGDSVTRSFSGDETVSMNMWGFTPQALSAFETGFAAFLDARGSEAKSEYFIPLAIDELIGAGLCRVEVLRSTDKWFGVTYQEDKPLVQAALTELVERGIYKTPLWG